jgi:hypothetical protein
VALRSPLGTTLAGSAGILLLSQMVAAPWSRLALDLMAALLLAVVVLQLGWRLLRHEPRRLVRRIATAAAEDDGAVCTSPMPRARFSA